MKIRERAHGGTDNAQMLAEDETVIDFKNRTPGISNGQDPPPFSSSLQAELHRFPTDVVDDHIGAFFAS